MNYEADNAVKFTLLILVGFVILLFALAYFAELGHKRDEAFCVEKGLMYDRKDRDNCYEGYYNLRSGEAEAIVLYSKEYLEQGGELYDCSSRQ